MSREAVGGSRPPGKRRPCTGGTWKVTQKRCFENQVSRNRKCLPSGEGGKFRERVCCRDSGLWQMRVGSWGAGNGNESLCETGGDLGCLL